MKFDDERYQEYPEFLARVEQLEVEYRAQSKELDDRANSPTVDADTLMALVREMDRAWSHYRQQVARAKVEFGVPTSWVDVLAEAAASAKAGKAEYRPFLAANGKSTKATVTQNNVTGTVTVEMHETYTISMDAEQAIDQINSYLTDKGLNKDTWVPVRLESEAGLTHSRER